ncbi:MBOAT family O-acyltransferase [Cerasicoccus frondis]|uniref:MBOAT family O-acyltransferase n=1 Tax=Cerasicoccus frondis TaxID=490090 RepID=UPI0028529F1E|nr:MBOAT family O-acyltransferase [Cerasicoccus frondis]
MLFNTLTFALFLLTVLLVYWGLCRRSRTLRNGCLLLASYIFYGWWDWRFLALILASSLAAYTAGRTLSTATAMAKRRVVLYVSLLFNLGLLFAFKYFDFFVGSLVAALNQVGIVASPWSLGLILPVGISFYTFQTLSYTIDVYHRKYEPTSDPLALFTYIAFFPQLVAGPIERADHILPQFQRERISVSAPWLVDGLRMILWGLFLKAVLADNLAMQVNRVYHGIDGKSGSELAMGALYFSFQIYGDFAGYSLMARGVARLFGIDLMVNFMTPYFSRNIGEFWRRWHISLSTWFRDYVYIPLGGSRGNQLFCLRNIFIVFLLSGLWHGADWTFIIWGAVHAAAFMPLFLLGKNRQYTGDIAAGRCLPPWREAGAMLLTFVYVTLAWIFFRAENLDQALRYFEGLFDASLFSLPASHRRGVIWIILLLAVEWPDRNATIPLRFPAWRRWQRWVLYLVLVCVIYYCGYFGETEFIYFQF